MPTNIKKLDKLIEQILLERFPSPYDKEQFIHAYGEKDIKVSTKHGAAASSPQSASAVFDVLANTVIADDELSVEDLRHLVANPEKIDVNVQSKLIAIVKNQNLNDEPLRLLAQTALDALENAVDLAAGGIQTVSAPDVQTQKANRGEWPPYMTAIVNRVFQGKSNTFPSRLRHLSQISEKYFNATAEGIEGTKDQARIANTEQTDLLAEILLLDVFNTVIKDFDSGSGGYMFEYLMALITGGKVVGKDMGAVDFVTKKGWKGSSKYYEKASSAMSQSIAGFKHNKPVEYVVAIKKQDYLQVDKTTRGVSDPNKIVALQVYNFKVRRTGARTYEVDGKSYNIEGKQTSIPIGNFVGPETSLGVVHIAKVRTGSFRNMIHQSLEQSSIEHSDLFSVFMKFYDDLQKAKELSKEYSVTGKTELGDATYVRLVSAQDNFEEIENKIGNPVKSQVVQENNINQLDKLIERVILDKMED